MHKTFADSLESSADEPPGSGFDGLGVANTPAIAETQLGSVRSVRSLTVKEWTFISITGSGIAASIAFAIYFLVTNANNINADFTLALLLLLNGVFTAYYLVDGIFTERAYELLVLILTGLLVTCYLLANFFYTQGWTLPVKIARLCVAGVLGPASIVLGATIVYEYLSSGNFIFRKVGADANLQRLCRRLFVTESVVKFDLQNTLSVVLLAAKGEVLSLADKLILGLGVGFSLTWSGLTVVALRLENYTLTIILLVAGLAQPAFMTFATIATVDNIINGTKPLIPDNADFSDSLPTVSLLTSLFALCLRVALFILIILTMRNYGQGLRRKLVPPILRRLTRSVSYENV